MSLKLSNLSQLQPLFRLFNAGKHLNRLAEPVLWAELEQYEHDYLALFAALGYSLKIDGRGFAWFHNEDASSAVNKSSRQLALLFMMVFEYQADAGKAIGQFHEWIIDKALLLKLLDQYSDLLRAEEVDESALIALMEAAVRYGFAIQEHAHWRLLPAVFRYLDHIEALAVERQDSEQQLEEDERE